MAVEDAAMLATSSASAPSRDDDIVLYKDEYAVTKEGNLIIGGDVQVRCRDILKFDIQPPSGNREIRERMEQDRREQAKLCKKAGFPAARAPR